MRRNRRAALTCDDRRLWSTSSAELASALEIGLGARSAGLGGAGLGARHPPDDVADCTHVVVEVGPRADHVAALVADLLQSLGGHRLERSTDDREPFQQVVEVLGAEREETAVGGRPHAGHSSPSSQQTDL